VGLILSLLRKTQIMNAQMKQGIWKKQMGNLLCGKRVGIVGFGRIGQKVAELLLPFGVTIGYSDLYEYSGNIKVPRISLGDLFQWSEIILLHASSQKDGRALIGKSEFEMMNGGVFIVNAARGGLIDEEALVEAIRDKKVAGAALDVYSNEPYEGRLQEIDEVILTPHIGSYAKEARVSMEYEAVLNLLKGMRL
jgi:D-3-phosphoglycerate dehydrogenase